MTRDITEASFLKDVATHEMKVLHDDGVYRHIRFKRPGTSCMHFDLVTWPGYLAYSGDMGCYVFERLLDMLEFFRGKPEGALRINLCYWSEKLQAVDGNRREASAKEFSEEKFRRAINDYRIGWMREARDVLTKAQRRDLWEAVQADVLDAIDDEGPETGRAMANRFSWRPNTYSRNSERCWHFTDLWEHDFTDYTYRFVWCCYALSWGIRQYDAAKVPTAAEVSA